MINLPHERCYGCSGCLNICPQDAISMKEDDYGYRYPYVDYSKCIKCGLCIKVCPELNSYTLNDPKYVYALQTKNMDILKTTASGGFATTLAEYVLSEKGVVYGCYEENFEEIGHIRIDKSEDLYKIKNSKYVHSDIRHCYREIERDLKKGCLVLFTGTPCQVSGLLGYLRKPYDNLVTMDLVCHGVPPMKMLKEQVLSSKKVRNISSKDIKVDFRWKDFSRSGDGSVCFGLRLSIKSGEKEKVIREENDVVNSYMRCFQTGISLRENCLRCPYARKERIADITAADFWGLGRDIPSKMEDTRGVSLVLINTEKGYDFYGKIAHLFIMESHTFDEAKFRNKCLLQPFERLKNRGRFLKLYKEKGLIYAAKKTDPIHKFEVNPIVKICRKNKISNLGVRLFSKLNRIINKYEK